MAKLEPSLKIGFVLDGGLEKPDGVQQYVLALGGWYISHGHEVRYLVAGNVPKSINNAVSLSRSLNVVSNGNRLSVPLPASRNKLKKYIENEKFDVLHVQTPYSPLLGERLILLSGPSTAIIGTFHIVPNSWYLSAGDWLLGKWCYRSLKRFDKMVSVSSAARAIAKRDFGIDSMVLPNVIDYKVFNEASPLEEYDDDKLTILFFGRLVPRKGCLVLLQAINYLKENNIFTAPYRVLVCGTGPLEDKLSEYVINHDLENIVEFKGYIDEKDKPSIYASANLSVFPSNGGESFGIVLLEAMASGRSAVLAGNNIGYLSVLKNRPDQLFNPNSFVELADKINKYLKTEALRKEAAKWGEVYASTFDTSIIGSKLLDIYKQTLIKKAR